MPPAWAAGGDGKSGTNFSAVRPHHTPRPGRGSLVLSGHCSATSQDAAAPLIQCLIHGRYIPEQSRLDHTTAAAAKMHSGPEDAFIAEAAEDGIADPQFSARLFGGVRKGCHS